MSLPRWTFALALAAGVTTTAPANAEPAAYRIDPTHFAIAFSVSHIGYKRVHFEFLDNSVPEGERPRTVAFGINGTMNILDLKFLFDIDRYRKIDISARSAQEVYAAAGSMAPSDNMSFLRDCIRRMTTICFADFGTGHVYAKLHQGRLTHLAADIAERAVENAELKATLGAIGVSGVSPPMPEPCEILRREEAQTLGRWGDAF